MLFHEEGKGWEAAWKDNKALAQWIEQTGQTMQTHAQTQQWESACNLTQQGPVPMLMPMESEVALKQWPTTIGIEARARHLWDSHGPPGFWKILGGKCNLHHRVLKAQAP